MEAVVYGTCTTSVWWSCIRMCMCLQIDEALLCLATAQNLEGGVQDLYFNHSRGIIETFKVWNDANLAAVSCMHNYIQVMHTVLWSSAFLDWQETYKNWSVHSTDCYMFSSLLSGAGPILGQLLDDVIPILSYCLNAEEPELRLQYVTVLHM